MEKLEELKKKLKKKIKETQNEMNRVQKEIDNVERKKRKRLEFIDLLNKYSNDDIDIIGIFIEKFINYNEFIPLYASNVCSDCGTNADDVGDDFLLTICSECRSMHCDRCECLCTNSVHKDYIKLMKAVFKRETEYSDHRKYGNIQKILMKL
jgi:hypothetical protein